ncbi:histidine kinase [Leptothrix cholodnii SP-6]|uniref:histidine kinase n=1 Tax=Leptothrix cholodnii (strain ATCC 51168 / LMG 8142 / SP-6) TaxID=395495 RepID=B1Y5M8_LEPCP|nr:sensor histidine kinase efflux regulator BaeS [Leptothrix cholodnii]ACB34740.1 histidine kinase [Leptothrix cholodnii SP-6]
MKRPGITIQLFLAVLAVATLVAVAMGAAAQLSFSRGFIGYLNEQAVQRMEAAIPRLQQAYGERGGSWAFLHGKPGAWFRLIEAEAGTDLSGPWDADPDLLAPHLLGLGRRLTLLDAQRQRVIGYPNLYADSEQREITVDGRSVGWIALAPIQSVTDAATLRFLDSQLRAILAMGALALVLATLIAWWVARALLAPVREVAAATHRLAAGHHDTRVSIRSKDEVGQLAQDFNQLALTLERNERMRRDYMADISHELRTPLSVLRGEIEAMEDGIHPLTPQNLGVLHGEVQTLTQLVNDLHELALADVGALRYRKTDLDLAPLLAREAAQFGTRCAERRLRLEVDTGTEAVTVQADADRLRQLLHNLLDNAVRYTDPGGSLQVRLRAQGTWAVIDIEDSAPGVPTEQLPRLFERFFRVEASRGRAGGGSGLGLAICRSIVQAHGGDITAHASPLGGVRIEIRLPLLQAVTENPA